ncbi:MAG: hypothetical protein JST00_39820 [Deltaproteobacteria bacterium]|nr:hypothetical protein [Deltaproteobacteria bacterium]
MHVANVTEQERKQRARGIASLLGVGGLVIVLGILRRQPGALEYVYQIGNYLETHNASGLSLPVFCSAVAHLELFFLALLLILGTRTVSVARRSLFGIVGAVATYGLVYADSAARYTARLGGHLYYLVCDDALISMRYARNFAEGRGLVYNASERVDGFTNPLWTAFMVLPHSVGFHEGVAPIPIVALGALLLAGTAYFSRAVLASAGASVSIQIVAALAILFDASLFDYSVVGLETPLVAFAASAVMAGVLLEMEKVVAVGIVLLVLARADGAIVAGVLVGWAFLDEAAGASTSLFVVARRRWRRVAVLVGAAAALVAWRMVSYGHPAPNTAYLKVYSLAARLPAGIASYGVRGLFWYGLPVACVLWIAAGYPPAARARRLLAPVIALWLYTMWIGGDAFSLLRFLAPVAAPFLWTAVGLAATERWANVEKSSYAIVAFVTAVLPLHNERGVLGATWDRSSAVREWVLTAKTLEANTPADASIATFYAGMPYYAPGRTFVDVLGKTESHIAHQTTIRGISPGHNKYDFSYVYSERRPDVTFTGWPCDEVDRWIGMTPDVFEREAPNRPESYRAPVDQLREPSFRELYYPQRVVLRDGDGPAGHMLGCWFVRKGSSVPIVWHVARP